MFAILLLLLSQSACTAQESTVVCFCKQGSASACEALRQTEPQLADALEKVAAQAHAMQEPGKAETKSQAEVETASDASTPTDCKGQTHHIISRPIAHELEAHETLRGHYKPRDPRFVTRAVDEKAHCGYQSWHRNVDGEVINWLRANRKATLEQFEALLREIYSRPAMRARFPHGF